MILLSLAFAVYEIIKENRQPVMKPKPIPKPIKIDDIIDTYGYQYDCEHYGKDFAEHLRKHGTYARVRRNIYG